MSLPVAALGHLSSEPKKRRAGEKAHAIPVAPFTVVAPIAAESVRVSSDRFRCEPYACVLSAASCQARRTAAGAQRTQSGAGGAALRQTKHTDGAVQRPVFRTGDYGLCRGCPVGEQIAQQIAN